MSQSPLKSDMVPPADPQSIPKWTRSYAQNRTLGVVIFLLLFLVLFAGIFAASHFAGEAYRSGNMLVLALSVVVLVVALVGTSILSVPRWSAKLQQRVVNRLYANEGNVAIAAPSGSRNGWIAVLGIGYGVCIIATVMMEFLIDVPTRYVQPITALYVVPFLLILWFLMRPMVGHAALIWPALYAVHAILSLAGAPIVFSSPWDSLNMIIPIVGYGMVAALVGHLYSRIALRRLKTLTQSGEIELREEVDHVGD